ncbi:DUF3995 domain-containing protein [Marinobacter halodurans]|uniref:DUF3995 domain-containing protein n=1 Tax=Marinobacter halodurans TaxID=2528979 RepID=A0ABY1ZM66_9GAMM|nr:DUF3995 domain-containing protein [Marinobacter halodurans]TBW57358.1 DUF3995 domain-containing protein [Marinobacter halodurans]
MKQTEIKTRSTFRPVRAGLKLVALALAMAPVTAFAEGKGISSWFTNFGGEFSTIVGVIVVIIGGLGICFTGFGIISALVAKKNREPMGYQPWFIFGGILAILLVPFIAAMGTSVSGQSQSESDVTTYLNESQ